MRRILGLAASAAIVFVIVLGGGCGDDSSTRSVVRLVSINNNQPLASDVRGEGSDPFDPNDDTITDDVVEVTIANYAHDNALELKPGYPFGDVIFTDYRVTFVRDDNGGPAPAGFSGAMYLKVPTSQSSPSMYVPPTGYILLVPASLKIESPLSDLADEGGQMNVRAHVEFIGKETTSEDEVRVTGAMMVSFANYEDEDE